MLKSLLFIFLSIFFAFNSTCQNYADSLTIELNQLAEESDISGFAVSAVSLDSILYKGGFGHSNITETTDYKTSTIQNIGSITKTTLAIAVMQLVEREMIHLDDRINQYLPFEVTNPFHPNKPITIRHLATHTSSLTDGLDDMTIEYSYIFQDSINFKTEELPNDYYEYFQIYRKNKSISMEKFLYNTYSKDGSWYSNSNFLKTPPGTKYQYSNIGSTLLALITEAVTGMKYSEYTIKNIFKPLGMMHTYWDISKIPENDIASLYMSNGLKIPHYTLITYPDGGLFTSIDDMSVYLNEMIRGINGKGILLTQDSYKEMMSNQLINKYFPSTEFKKTKGLIWDVNRDGDNISANGSDPGINTYLLFTTAGNIGILMFMNSNFYGNEQMKKDFYKIRSILFKYISKIIN